MADLGIAHLAVRQADVAGPRCAGSACGQVAHSRSKVGVRAWRTALSAASSRQPQPSRITSITGRRFCSSCCIGPCGPSAHWDSERIEPVLRDRRERISRTAATRVAAGHAATLPASQPSMARLRRDAPVIAGESPDLPSTRWHGTTNDDRVLADRGADRARGLRRCRSCRRCPNRWWRWPIGMLQQRLPHPHLEVGADQHDAQRPVRPPQLRIEDARARAARCALCPRHSSPSASGRACRRASPAPRRDRRTRGRRARAASPSPARCRTARDGSRRRCVRPSPPDFHSPGDIASWVTNRSCSRPGPGQADLVGGVEHARRIAQQLARAVERDRLQEGFRRQPGPAAEQVVQFGRRDADGVRDLPRSRAARASARRCRRWRGARRRSRRRRWRAASRSGMRSGESMAVSIICSRSRSWRPHPPDSCSRLLV